MSTAWERAVAVADLLDADCAREMEMAGEEIEAFQRAAKERYLAARRGLTAQERAMLDKELMHRAFEGLHDAVGRLAARIKELEQGALKDAGVWRRGRSYVAGSLVSHKGTAWAARSDTTDMPGSSTAWRLLVKTRYASE